MAKRKALLPIILLSFSVLLGGCLIAKPADVKTESPDVTLSGTISRTGPLFFLTTADRGIIQLDSREVDLSGYTNLAVTLTGQYSGTTLFVSKIE